MARKNGSAEDAPGKDLSSSRKGDDEAARMMELFAGFEGAHGTHGQPTRNGLKWEIKSTARTLREPVTVELWRQHLSGKRPLGVAPLRADGRCSWGSVDVDDYDVNLLEIASRVEKAAYPLVPCRSKSGGLHLFLFVGGDGAEATLVQAVLRDIAASIGLAGSEIFPKQTKLSSERNDLPNWIVMPYYGDTYGGRLRDQVGIRSSGGEMTLRQFIAAAEKATVSEKELEKIAEAGVVGEGDGRGSRAKKNGSGKEREKKPFSDGPPCLQHLARSGFPEGGRNKSLFHMAVYFKRASPGKWEQLLERANAEHVKPPLPPEEVLSIVRSLNKKTYEYLCRDEPMVSHCDSILCRARKYGVGGGQVAPNITGITKINEDPPTWIVDVEDKRVTCTTEELFSYQKFSQKCLAEVNLMYKAMKHDSWASLVSEALKNLIVVDVEREMTEEKFETTITGEFYEFLVEFCTDNVRGDRKEDLLYGRPWEDAESKRVYFSMRAFCDFLNRYPSGKEFAKHRYKVGARVEGLGGGRQKNVVGNHSMWWIPTSILPPPVLQIANEVRALPNPGRDSQKEKPI